MRRNWENHVFALTKEEQGGSAGWRCGVEVWVGVWVEVRVECGWSVGGGVGGGAGKNVDVHSVTMIRAESSE